MTDDTIVAQCIFCPFSSKTDSLEDMVEGMETHYKHKHPVRKWFRLRLRRL